MTSAKMRVPATKMNLTPIMAAVGLIVLWTAMIFAIPSVMSLFIGFKVEIPALTRTVFWASQLFGRMALPL